MTDQQIDEFLEMLAKSPTSARDMVRGLFAAHEAKAAPAVPQGEPWPLPWLQPLGELVSAAKNRDASREDQENAISSAHSKLFKILRATPAAPSQPVTLTDSSVDAAAKILAERFDYSWEHMPEQGRENMRKNVRNVVAALREKGQAK